MDFDNELMNLAYYSLGIAGESGELVDKLKKVIRDDNGNPSQERLNLIKLEMGDVLWYIANVADKLGIKLDDIAQANLNKLKDRQKRDVLSGDGDNR